MDRSRDALQVYRLLFSAIWKSQITQHEREVLLVDGQIDLHSMSELFSNKLFPLKGRTTYSDWRKDLFPDDLDPWNRPYQVLVTPTGSGSGRRLRVVFYSLGEDGEFSSRDLGPYVEVNCPES